MLLIKQTIYMQMLFIKSLFVFLFSISLCNASSSFIEQFQVDSVIDKKLANRITQYNTEDIKLSLPNQKFELLKIDKQLNKLNTHKDKAIYWFIKGLHYKNLADFYMQNNNPSLAYENIKNKNLAYKKAIELDQSNKQLSAAIFSTMKLGLPEDLKIQATKNELALGGNGDSDSYYWYLHWSNIDQLQNAGRQDEAKAAYKTMQRELKNSGMDMSVYSSLTKKIETQTLNINSSQNNKKPSPAKKEKTTQKPNAEPKEKNSPKKYDTKFIIIFSIAVFSIISLITAVVYEVKRKRKKKNRK